MILALIGIIYGVLVAMVQPNMKKLIAYSSVSHLGFVVLGIFSFTTAGLNGAMFVMLAHGVSTGALFMLAGILHERRHTYEISEFGGLAAVMPVYAASYLFIVLASVGLPLLNGFIGEFLVLSGAFQAKPIYGVLGATRDLERMLPAVDVSADIFGKVTHPVNNSLHDLFAVEKAAVWPCAVAALVMGVVLDSVAGAIDPAHKPRLRRLRKSSARWSANEELPLLAELLQTIPPGVDYIRILPELVLSVFGIVVMVLDPLVDEEKSQKPLGYIGWRHRCRTFCHLVYGAYPASPSRTW